jgi:pimeloyl-ACP methyl ester carboxylesterase
MNTQPTPHASPENQRLDRRQALRRVGFGLLGLGSAGPWLAGCSLLPRRSEVPMPQLHDAAASGARADTLVVMLPGRFDQPQDFVREGLVADLRRQRPDVDLRLVDAHLGYYLDRSVLERLRQDVIGPARAQGYRQVWLAGISLGGFGALGYAARHGQEADAGVDGVLAIAPYLGSDAVLAAMAAAGGPQRWLASPARLSAIDLEQDVWQWLAEPPLDSPPVFLGFGWGDRMGQAHRLAASLLPAGRVMPVEGGHDWAPWRAVWRQWLAQGPLAEGPGRSA